MDTITSSLSVEQMRTATKAAIVADIASSMTKRDLIILATGSDKLYETPVITYHKDGQIESQSETFRDVETGAVLSSKVITWTYYETGEVDEIVIFETDGGGKELEHSLIKHYTDGRQPDRYTEKALVERMAAVKMEEIDTPEEVAELTLWQKILKFFGVDYAEKM